MMIKGHNIVHCMRIENRGRENVFENRMFFLFFLDSLYFEMATLWYNKGHCTIGTISTMWKHGIDEYVNFSFQFVFIF